MILINSTLYIARRIYAYLYIYASMLHFVNYLNMSIFFNCILSHLYHRLYCIRYLKRLQFILHHYEIQIQNEIYIKKLHHVDKISYSLYWDIGSDIWFQNDFWEASSLCFQSSFSTAWYLEEVLARIPW